MERHGRQAELADRLLQGSRIKTLMNGIACLGLGYFKCQDSRCRLRIANPTDRDPCLRELLQRLPKVVPGFLFYPAHETCKRSPAAASKPTPSKRVAPIGKQLSARIGDAHLLQPDFKFRSALEAENTPGIEAHRERDVLW